MAFAQAQQPLTSSASTYAIVEAQAKQQRKPILVFFNTPWCDMCKHMQNYTFTEPTLASYIKNGYLTYIANGEVVNKEGHALAQKYDVDYFPTILVLDEDLEPIHKATGFRNAKDVLAMLQSPRENMASFTGTIDPTDAAIASVNARYANPAPSASLRTASPSISLASAAPSANSASFLAPMSSTNARTAAPSTNMRLAAAPSTSTSFGLMEVSMLPQSGYAVQIGVFTGFHNIADQVQKIEVAGYGASFMHVMIDGQEAFKVFAGPFSNYTEAQQAEADLATKGIKGMLLKL